MCQVTQHLVKGRGVTSLTWTGFEPVWGDPIGFQVQHLNLSATMTITVLKATTGSIMTFFFVSYLLWTFSRIFCGFKSTQGRQPFPECRGDFE